MQRIKTQKTQRNEDAKNKDAKKWRRKEIKTQRNKDAKIKDAKQ